MVYLGDPDYYSPKIIKFIPTVVFVYRLYSLILYCLSSSLSHLPPKTRAGNRHRKTDPFFTDTNIIVKKALLIKN